jgi:hypothetical protein
MPSLPSKIFAETLNLSFRREQRGKKKDRSIPLIHVSSLIRLTDTDRFCAREFVLTHAEDRDSLGGGVPPKFQLLWDTGKFLGDYIITQFIQRNPEFRGMLWGDWICACGETKRIHASYDHSAKCNKCGHGITNYVETDLFNKSKTVIGHADIILLDTDNVFHVYEVKTIDRADVPWDTLAEPLGDHLVQASNYRYMLLSIADKLGYTVSPIVRFIYIDRSMTELYRTPPFKELEAQCIDLKRLARIYVPAKQVQKAFATRQLPDRICDKIDCGRAKKCPVAVSCFERRKKTFRVM